MKAQKPIDFHSKKKNSSKNNFSPCRPSLFILLEQEEEKVETS